jgi:soluble lytic murein transglycosylase-like protein
MLSAVFTLLLLAIPLTSSAVCKCVTLECKNQQAVRAILIQLKKHGAKDAVPAKELAPAILHMAQYYDVDYMTVTKIILVESRGRESAYNKKTHDYGLMQINARTAKDYEAEVGCLFNWRCNLRVGVEVLSNAKRICAYNLGNSRLSEARMRKCLRYEKKLATIY